MLLMERGLRSKQSSLRLVGQPSSGVKKPDLIGQRQIAGFSRGELQLQKHITEYIYNDHKNIFDVYYEKELHEPPRSPKSPRKLATQTTNSGFLDFSSALKASAIVPKVCDEPDNSNSDISEKSDEESSGLHTEISSSLQDEDATLCNVGAP